MPEEVTYTWKQIKEYLEMHDYLNDELCDLEDEDWAQVRNEVRKLDATERRKMMLDMSKLYKDPKYLKRVIEKQERFKRKIIL